VVTNVRRVKRLLKLLAGVLGLVVYVWFAAVRNLGTVKRRKAARRSRRG
jgi:hypothetical protein